MNYEVEIHDDVFLPVYQHLLVDDEIDIDFLYGTRDTGKSRHIAQTLIKRCLSADYFRHILCRKVHNSIKDSQWQVLKDVVDDWGLSELFDFKTSPLEIHCKNGNKFIARGFDDPQKIKSIQNPSGAWVEEGNQLTKEDWVTLITSLRSNKGNVKIDFSFNPECDGDYREFWLYKDYFSHTTEQTFFNTKYMKVGDEVYPIHYRATHASYYDNPYCTPQRKAYYEELKYTAPYFYQIYALGKWANKLNKSPFVLTFNREKHLGKTEYNPKMPIYLSFDFNRNPMCVTIFQTDLVKKVDVIEVIKLPNSDIWQVCEYIVAAYGYNALYYVCGDSSGHNQSALVKENDLNNYYKVIKSKLRLTTQQMKTVHNPPIIKNQVLVNACFRQLDITINPETCQPLIFDIEFGEILADGTLKKGSREDEKQQLDALDTLRYFLNRFFKHIAPE